MNPYINTVKTTLGYIRSMFEKTIGLSLKRNSLSGVYNYLPLEFDNQILRTSGQPTESQFFTIKEQGITHIINLAPHNAENALGDERATAAKHGLNYIHIPVNFQKPTDADFERFAAELKPLELNSVWVHCAANMRVSAFVFRYRRQILHDTSAAAERDLKRIWEPFGVWKKFINRR